MPKETNKLILNQETLRRLTGALVVGSRSDTVETVSGSQVDCTDSCVPIVCPTR